MARHSKEFTLEDAWKMIRELRESQKEFGKETDRLLKEMARETKLKRKEIDRDIREGKKRMAELQELFTGQWGKLMESLVKGDLITLLKEKNIEVEEISPERERKWNGEIYEFDIVAINGHEIVVVEVKTTLTLKDLKHFMDKLKLFKKIFPIYSKQKIYGAIAYLKANEGTAKKSEKEGLFVIRATGSSASITNAPHFRPREF